MTDRPIALALLEAEPQARPLPSGGWQAECPAHEDRQPSLSWTTGEEGQVLVTCHAGCSTKAVLKAMGLRMGDLYPSRESPAPHPRPKVIRTTEYTVRDRAGAPQAIHIRRDMSDGTKGVSWKLPDGSTGLGGRPASSLPLYLIHELDGRSTSEPVVLVEGEKVATALVEVGIPAVGTVTGASGRPSDEVLHDLEGRTVICWPDNDPQGRAHMLDMALRLGSGVSWVEPPSDRPKGWDAADLLDEPDGLTKVRAMLDRASAVLPDPMPAGDPRDGRTLIRLSEVKPERVSWLWKDRIPMGKVTVIDGDPGQGKSTMTLDLAARVSRGLAMPDGSPGVGPGRVLILSAEDDPADTIRPRLEAAGADLDRVLALSGIGDPERLPALPLDLPVVEEEVIANGISLVIVDPLMAYLGGDVNGHRDQDVRRALAPLAMMAQRTGAAVVLVRHLNKSTGGSAMYRGGGSIGITGAARSVLLVARDPDAEPVDPSPRRIVAVVKSNLAPTAPSMAYRLVTDASTGVEIGKVVWETGPTGHLASDLVAPPERHGDDGSLSRARGFLADLLKDGPMAAREVKEAAEANGLSWATVRRAQDSAGVLVRRVSDGFGGKGHWEWSRPQGAQGAQPPEGEHLVSTLSGWTRPEHGSVTQPPEYEHLVEDQRTAFDPVPVADPGSAREAV